MPEEFCCIKISHLKNTFHGQMCALALHTCDWWTPHPQIILHISASIIYIQPSLETEDLKILAGGVVSHSATRALARSALVLDDNAWLADRFPFVPNDARWGSGQGPSIGNLLCTDLFVHKDTFMLKQERSSTKTVAVILEAHCCQKCVL